jgi:predicted MFS family arabinose efflux permease
MTRPPIHALDLLGYFNPWTLSRLAWLTGKRGWARLWRAPGANSRFFIATTFVWSGAMALTEPYKALYLSKLGLSHLAIGGFFALDMGLRIGGVLLGGMMAQRWGHKAMLLSFDTVAWVVSMTVLALATEPWHVYLATCLFATNALVAGSVVQLLVEDTPADKRTPTFALFNLAFVLPSLLLPAFSGWMVERWGVVPVMRVLFGLTAVATGLTTLWRYHRLRESTTLTPQADLGALLRDGLRTARHLGAQALLLPVLGLFLLSNMLMNLNKAWQGLYITGPLGLSDAWIGHQAAAGAVCFVAVSLLWAPRLRAELHHGLLFWACLLGALPGLGLAWAWHPALVLALGALGGTLGALQGPLLAGHLTALFPPGREGLAHALLSSVMQAAVALSLVLGGALFETRFGAFPWVAGAMGLAMGALAWALWKGRN